MLGSILSEPLIRFLGIGALIFAASLVLADDQVPDDRQITVTRERVEQLETAWASQWRRAPSDQELQGLIAAFIREEVLYREGVAMGLDRDDTIVRRRVAQKMEFLIEDLTAPVEPDDETLRVYYEQDSDPFREPARLSFAQIYFSADRRGARAEADALEALQALAAGTAGPDREIGDPLLLRQGYELVTSQQVARDFGRPFADAVFGLQTDRWQGPVRSGYGVHLVRVSERIEARLPDFAEVREQVLAAWLDDHRRRSNEQAIEAMSARYRIFVEGEGPTERSETRTRAPADGGNDS